MNNCVNNYVPDHWNIIKVTETEDNIFYRIAAGWSGSYLYGDSWRINSKIKEFHVYPEHVDFLSESGSNYTCYKLAEGLRGHAMIMISDIVERVVKNDYAIAASIITLDEFLAAH